MSRVKDKDYKEFLEGIKGFAHQIQALQKQALNEYKPIVENIIENRNSNVKQIEGVLDRLIEVAADGERLELYHRLCRYLYSLNQQKRVLLSSILERNTGCRFGQEFDGVALKL